jgi:excinuclease ABC subunit C
MVKKLKWNRENTLKGLVPNRPGLYKFYDKNGNLIYVGHAKALRHRVQSYRQKDCFIEHNEKKPLRPKIASYSYKVMPKKKAMAVERKIKKKTKYNIL